MHQFAALAGYGAEAINPYLAFETIEANLGDLEKPVEKDEAFHRYVKAIGKGLMKVMSNMGISTYQSYCGAQIFDAVGLKTDFVAKWFTGTHTAVEGEAMNESRPRQPNADRLAFADVPVLRDALDAGGEYAYRMRGEAHAWNPDTTADLQHAVRGNLPEKYSPSPSSSTTSPRRLMTIRGLFRAKDAAISATRRFRLTRLSRRRRPRSAPPQAPTFFGLISREATLRSPLP